MMANEKRLIDANALRERKFTPPLQSFYSMGWNDAIDAIRMKAPTVDAVEVVHARWINIKEYGSFCVGFCSDCAAEQKATNATALRAFHRYCRWCGAKMDGGNEDAN